VYFLHFVRRSKRHKIQQNYRGSVYSFDIWPGNETGLFYSTMLARSHRASSEITDLGRMHLTARQISRELGISRLTAMHAIHDGLSLN